LSLGDARRLVEGYVEDYNNFRLNSAIGYIRPKDMLARASAGDPCRAGSEAGGGTKAAADSSPAGCVKNEKAYVR
jgi:hypothetical protein